MFILYNINKFYVNLNIIYFVSYGHCGQVGDEIELVELDRWVQTLPLFLSCILVTLNSLLDTAKAFRGDPETVFIKGLDAEDGPT